MPVALEQVPINEAASIQAIIDASLQLQNTHARPVRRGQHGKTNAIARARFTVAPGIPDAWRVGLFAREAPFDALVRFSNGGQTDDRKADAHGMAIKLLDVPGARCLDGDPPSRTHDFVLLDCPTFFMRNAADYAEFSRAAASAARMAHRLPLPEGLRKKAMGVTLLFTYLLSHRYEFAALRRMRSKGRPPLATTYHSNTIYRLGDRAVRYVMRPVDATATAAPRGDGEDWLRQSITRQLQGGEASFEFYALPQDDPSRQPVEDPTIAWDDDTKPWAARAGRHVLLGTLHIPAQPIDRALDESEGEGLAFNPYNAMPEHAPIGGINRTRRAVYEVLSRQRHQLNGLPTGEPVSLTTHTPRSVPAVR